MCCSKSIVPSACNCKLMNYIVNHLISFTMEIDLNYCQSCLKWFQFVWYRPVWTAINVLHPIYLPACRRSCMACQVSRMGKRNLWHFLFHLVCCVFWQPPSLMPYIHTCLNFSVRLFVLWWLRFKPFCISRWCSCHCAYFHQLQILRLPSRILRWSSRRWPQKVTQFCYWNFHIYLKIKQGPEGRLQSSEDTENMHWVVSCIYLKKLHSRLSISW